jgi:hypothetical protein
VRYAKKYSDDMVENLTESPGMCSDGPRSAPIEIPKRGCPSLRKSKRERERERDVERGFCGLGRRKEELFSYLLATGAPPVYGTRGYSATHPRTVREVRGWSGTSA